MGKEIMLDSILMHEANARATLRERKAHVRQVVVSKKEELEALGLPELQQECSSLGITGRLTKQARIEMADGFEFESDNEGFKLWPQVGDIIDTINIMAYDAGTPDGGSLRFNFSTILSNFRVQGGVDERKINMGFEAGEQAAGGIWEGEEADELATRDIVRRNSGGAMIWAVNPQLGSASASFQTLPTSGKGLGTNL